ncbi:hypothetical protein COP2_019200 [Malus domestica]
MLAEDDQANTTHTQDTLPESPEEEDRDPMGYSVLDNMEISMVHVLPAEFQLTISQPNFLDGDVVAEEATQVDFVAAEEIEMATKEDKLKAALAELFLRSS